MPGLKQAVNRLKKTLKPGDLLLTLGAGDVWKIGEDILKKL
jgi:UDP-N-acetylmuramate--alanine ligase